ncbi:hypothetical protein [Variovorax sp. KK3]|uniref:hypothetical protein n=1 Tax=Variovorax sp. KK3 TaxID=1855728 RepID=UPI0015C3C742|nr:hypothetical protein [Variovorax sp. KK3]
MSSGLIITLEMLGVLGVVVGLGLWKLYGLRRDKRRPKRAKPVRPGEHREP